MTLPERVGEYREGGEKRTWKNSEMKKKKKTITERRDGRNKSRNINDKRGGEKYRTRE